MGRKKKDTTETKPPDKVKVKTKRTDVAERKQKNKEIQFVCVKAKLNSIALSKEFVYYLQYFIYQLNQIKFLSYILLNYEFTYLIENNMELPDITQNLFYRACCHVSKFDERKSKVSD